MARIKIDDLPVLQDLTAKQMKGLFGGELDPVPLGWAAPSVFEGEIQYVEPQFVDSEGMSCRVSGYELMHRLTRGADARTWGDSSAPPPVSRFDPQAMP